MVECLRQHVQDSCADLVFTLDEVGISEWEDRVARKMIVPISMSEQTVHQRIHRNVKHLSVVCCVSVSEESMTPFMVSLQVNDSVIERLKTEGFRMRVHLILERRQKPYLTAALFQQYVTTVLIPFINRVRTNVQFAGKPAILLMDNCCIQTRPEIPKILRGHDVKMVTFPPHTIQVFQALDLSLFDALKRTLQSKLPLGNVGQVLAFIQKVSHSVKQTCVLDNVQNAFKMLGFEFNIAKSPYTLLLREEKLRGSQGFREIWNADYPLDQLSKRRREARYEWINQNE
jgi:hypothetical protein